MGRRECDFGWRRRAGAPGGGHPAGAGRFPAHDGRSAALVGVVEAVAVQARPGAPGARGAAAHGPRAQELRRRRACPDGTADCRFDEPTDVVGPSGSTFHVLPYALLFAASRFARRDLYRPAALRWMMPRPAILSMMDTVSPSRARDSSALPASIA